MSVDIAYSGIKEKYLAGIQRYLEDKHPVFTPISYENLGSLLSARKHEALIIGEEISSPIRMAQAAYSIDNSLSILIIAEPAHYKKLKQALIFTPFIGSSVNCISDGDDVTVAGKVMDLINRTQQRRHYQTLKSISIPVRTSPRIEQLKNEYINRFFEKAPVGAILLDQNSSILGLNRQTSEIFNCDETDILGNKLSSFFPEAVRNQVREFLQHEYKIHPKKNFQKSDFPEQHIEIAVTEVNLADKLLYKIAIVDDITEKVSKERQIQDQMTELKKINSDLDNFIYTASHDLKSPISNIEGLVYTLKDISENNEVPEEQKHVLELLEKSIIRFKNTIQDLSDIAKIQKNIEEDIDDVSVREIVEEVSDSLEKEIKDTGTEFNVSYENCPAVRISRANLKSVVYNLLSNAVKYRSPHRKTIITVNCTVREEFVILEVKDNGLGISENNIGKMFSMFKRFHDHVEGTGVGLYIVKRILDNSGGKIEVISEEGKGTEFKVYFRKA